MNWRTVRVLLSNELRMLLRDRRTVVLAVVLPILTMPLILFATRIMHERRARNLREATYRYVVVGSEKDRLRSIISQSRRLQIAGVVDEEDLRDFKFIEVEAPDPAASLRTKDLDFYLEALSGAQADASAQEAAERRPARKSTGTSKQPPGQARLPGVPLVRIYFRGDRDLSQAGRNKMASLLQLVRHEQENALLVSSGFPVPPPLVGRIDSEKLATPSQVAGSRVGRLLTVLLVMFLLSGGAVVAMDSVAGEKERGSLETLLTTAAGRGEIVAAKQMSIFVVALVITVIQIVNLVAAFKVVRLPQEFVYQASPLATITILLLFLPVAAFIASVLLTISAYAKSYKEAQLYFFPLYLVSLLPAMASVLPGIRLRSAIAVVPLANVSVAVRDVMIGRFDWPMILLVLGTMTAAAVWTMRRSTTLLSQERLITASETDAADFSGGAAVFPRHVLRWYGVIGAVLLAIAINVPQLSQFRAQILFNELVLFLGGPLLMILRYRLSVREALALRATRPMVWAAALLIIPSGNLVGIGVFRLADLILPVPRQMLEQFSRDLLPKDVPVWEMVLLLAVLPGICEEIAFRGTLLYGLRRRLRPVPLALAVGLIFGLFHVALFRLIPTAFMGVFLTAIALLTGSILPCMLVHAGNNALAYFASEAQVPLATQAWWVYAGALFVFLFAFYIIYRNRTPYPDLKTSRL